MGETGMRINDQSVITLNLHIEGPGITPFDATGPRHRAVTRMGNFTQGKLVVLVDPATNKFQIDWERSSLVNGLVPAQFTVAEDNKTYDLTGQERPLMEILQLLKANGIPLNRMVDVRSNPAVRQQLRRSCAARQPASQPAAASPAGVAPTHAVAPPARRRSPSACRSSRHCARRAP